MMRIRRIFWVMALTMELLQIHAVPLIYSTLENGITGDEEIVSPRIFKRQNDVLLVIAASSETFYLQLRPTMVEGSKPPNVTVFGRTLTDDISVGRTCDHYMGRLLSSVDGQAAISICNPDSTLSGVILVNGRQPYILRPATNNNYRPQTSSSQSNNRRPKRKVKDSGEIKHVLYTPSEQYRNFCGVQTNTLETGDANLLSSRVRIRRSSPDKPKVIETAVYVDFPLYEKFLSSTELEDSEEAAAKLRDTVLAIVNEVQLIYNYKSLKTKFKIIVVKLEILSENKESPDPAEGNIDEYLDNFCNWQSLKNPPVDSKDHWDHALMLTGLDLHKVTLGDKRNEKVLGLAWVNGMCRPQHSCTLNEGSTFEAAFVIAHEMGHSLGMLHDGRGNDCDPNTFLMSEKTGPGKITWSECSNDYLDAFFKKGFGACLENDNTPPLSSMDHEDDDRLPGERFPLDEQCKLSLGTNFKPHVVPKQPFNNVCRELWCVSGLWASVAHPALEGSECAVGKRCIQGECTKVHQLAYTSGRLSTTSTTQIVADMKDAVADFLDRLRSAFMLLGTS